MKNTAIARAVIVSAFSFVSISAYAAFLSLPNTGSVSAYLACNTSGNFGFGLPTFPPTDSCIVTQSGISPPDLVSEGLGYSIYVGSAKTRSIQVNNIYTGGISKTIGSLQDWVWKNAAGTSCIYGTKVTMTLAASADYDVFPGTQYFEVNDIARGGFQGKTVKAAYAWPGSPSALVYRIGRAYTAVQYRASGYTALPLTGLGSHPSINGLDSFFGTASSTQQLADYHDNWVDFSTDISARHFDGSTSANSSWFFVKADACPALNTSGLPEDTPSAIRIRQTFKRKSSTAPDQRFIEISLPGFAPAGAHTLPAHTDPY